MTSPIGAIGGISPISAPTSVGRPAAPTDGANFAGKLSQGLQSLQGAQDNADDLAVKAATGDLTDVHDYMIASTEASLGLQLTTAVRNKALDAFNEIMRMQA